MNWKRLIDEERAERGDDSETVKVAPNESVLSVEFSDGYGSAEGPPFTLWTRKRAYFPVVYDGAEWVGSVPRDPCDEATAHVGGQ